MDTPLLARGLADPMRGIVAEKSGQFSTRYFYCQLTDSNGFATGVAKAEHQSSLPSRHSSADFHSLR